MKGARSAQKKSTEGRPTGDLRSPLEIEVRSALRAPPDQRPAGAPQMLCAGAAGAIVTPLIQAVRTGHELDTSWAYKDKLSLVSQNVLRFILKELVPDLSRFGPIKGQQ